MDAEQLESLARSLTETRSRRGTLAAVLGGTLGLLGLAGTAAKKKNKKQGKRKKKRKTSVPPPPSVSSPPAPLPPPPLPSPQLGPGFCAYDGTSSGLQATRRYAQTFLPPRAGQLTQAVIGLRINPANFSLIFDVRSVNAAGVPTETVLASTTVSNIGQTVFSTTTFRHVTATFASPATLVLGQSVALSVSEATGAYAIHVNNGGNICSDGTLFLDNAADNTFVAAGNGNADLVYTLTVA